jgi:ATP-dependent DNA helicase RecQ
MRTVSFFDLETDPDKNLILDIGCIRWDDATFHDNSVVKFVDFVKNSDFIAGHNIFRHDLTHLHKYLGATTFGSSNAIDTLYLSPLLFPSKPYHRLVKDDKLQVDEINNPQNDSIKAKHLFFDEVSAFNALDENIKEIFFALLSHEKEFACFFEYLDYSALLPAEGLERLIQSSFSGKICERADLRRVMQGAPVALAYSLALINSNDRYSITPPWVLHNFPDVERVLFLLRGKPCVTGCLYCDDALNPFKALKRHFNYDKFRSYGGAPLQENAVNAAIRNKSLLAIFPTGGGKSITFQLPALMSGENTKALTVIISPLQSLMKDQVDNLERKSITDAVTINGLLNPIERSKAIERIHDGGANLLYISPESLRSVTIERLLLGRKIARFVIDEAHCFSSWGQDFRVDYLYIGDFIRNLQNKKGLEEGIPVSCFTATAKQKVIEDIREYFKQKLNLNLDLFSADASRTNLQYQVFNQETEEGKYVELRSLIERKPCPTIVYVSRTRTANKLADKLVQDGYNARKYHGKMEKEEKTANQNAFIEGSVDIMVATSAFGMGVDKSDVGMVIHYDISDSLENYVQEAGRAGRDESLTADCFVLFNEEDLNKHFVLLNQTKLDIKEINQVWKAIKDLTKTRERASNSALEIARKAGWDENIKEIETRVTSAIAALEDAGYLKRGQNMPRVFANSILAHSAQEAIDRINASEKFSQKQRTDAIQIIKKLFSSKSKRLATEEAAESRVDYIAENLGIVKEDVFRAIQLLKDENILADTKDLTAFIKRGENSNRSLQILQTYKQLEEFLLTQFSQEDTTYNLKELNEHAIDASCSDAAPNKINTLLNFLKIKNWIIKQNADYSRNHLKIVLTQRQNDLCEKMAKRHLCCQYIVEHLFAKAVSNSNTALDEILVEFSVTELKEEIEKAAGMFTLKPSNEDVEDSLFYLSRIEAIKIEGGFLVVYNRLTIDRIEKNNYVKYKHEDYQKLKDFYDNKVQQIHIVGEYAKKMVQNYKDALQFVDDYFKLNYESFLKKYFPGNRLNEIKRTLTPAKFRQLFDPLSTAQQAILRDASKHIVVAAGPGSGKTRVLVHKLASLLLIEDIKHEQLLMLTFSRAAATEFKKRLLELIGNAANFIEIKTFHSYCFDLIGKVGNLTDADSVLDLAVNKIKNGDVEPGRITKAVLVVDEAQDMNGQEFTLVRTLMEQNEEMKVLLVGDDDQNIYEFRKANSRYMASVIESHNAKLYELVDNYRSKANIVKVANQWAAKIPNRLKSTPIMPVSGINGKIRITEYATNNLVVPLMNSLRQTDLSGSTCVLTRTNDEAVQVAGLLTRNSYTAKLIQTNEDFNLTDLKELRYFTERFNGNEDSPVVSDETWENAKQSLNTQFSASSKLEWCKAIIADFEAVNPYRKYKSDWKTFLNESKFEDFVKITSETIFVSTIHKAKGREFENVFLLLSGFDIYSDEVKRQIYVAMTRAKTNLYIHYNADYFQPIKADNLIYLKDSYQYGAPEYISLLLSHRDVWLGYFDKVQYNINSVISGTSLNVTADGLINANGQSVLRFSKGFQERLQKLNNKGYSAFNAKANFVVFWTNQETGKEIKIILPELTFIKNV